MKKFYIYALIFCLLFSMTGCGRKEAVKKAKEEVIPVKVETIEPRDLVRALEYVGTVKGGDEAIVYPKVSGKIVEKVKEDGSPVVKGEAIAYIDRDEVGLKFEKAPIESPLTGVVGRMYVDLGVNVTPQTQIALISDMREVTVIISIPEKYVPELSLGQTAMIAVDAYPKKEFAAKVTKISPVLDIETRATPIELVIDDQEKLLRSGMFAKVKLILKEMKDATVIMKEAVIGKGEDTYVFVVEGQTASLRKVKLGIRQGPYYEVTEGLNAREKVVVMGQQRLNNGSQVKIEE